MNTQTLKAQNPVSSFTVTDQDFNQEVLQSDTPVLVDFWAAWCGPCRALEPTVEALAEEFQGKVKVAKLNVDENPEAAARYGVRSIPTLIVFKDGQVQEAITGARPKGEFVQVLEQYV